MLPGDRPDGNELLPFGQPLSELPTKLLEAASNEYGRRVGFAMAAKLNGKPPPVCPACGPEPGLSYRWVQFRDGRWNIERRCRRCNRHMAYAPQEEPFIGMADAAATAG
jgi:hypothetical protein